MSNRLDSLNGKKTGSAAGTAPAAAKSSLKFKPKAVSRRTNEERAKDAPIIKVEDNGHSSSRSARGSMRGGRGGARGGRNNYAGTHLVSLGPLSSGTVSLGGGISGSKTGFTRDRVFNSQSPTPEYLLNLKLKDLSLRDRAASPGLLSGGSTPVSAGYFSDDDIDDPTRINMNEEYRFADEETVLFPVRPLREDDENETISVSLATPTPALEAEPIRVKSEEPDSVQIKQEPGTESVENASAAVAASQVAVPTSGSLEEEEAAKYMNDYSDLSSILASLSGEYFSVSLPTVLPEYTGGVVAEQAPVSNSFSADSYPQKGQIGHVNIHKSGKMTINLGNNNVLEVTKGIASSFLQEVAVLELDAAVAEEASETKIEDDEQVKKPKGKLIRLGSLNNKLIGSPAL